MRHNDKSINLFKFLSLPLCLSLCFLSLDVQFFSIEHASISFKHKINAYIKHDHKYIRCHSYISSIYGDIFYAFCVDMSRWQLLFHFRFAYCILPLSFVHSLGFCAILCANFNVLITTCVIYAISDVNYKGMWKKSF